MATRRRDDESRRISQLPKHILQHILSFLPQRDAIRTCLLSKSCRHLGPTRPNVVLRESNFWCINKRKFLSALEKTLQTYQDQKLSIQDLHVEMSSLESESSSILGKLVKNLNVTKFRLALTGRERFPLPRFIFEAESLEEIHLTRLKLIDEKVHFNHLKTLHLKDCYIEDETFANIVSSCPLIEYLVLDSCKGLKTIKLDKAHNLTRFEFTPKVHDELENISFLNNHFPHLKSLYLRFVPFSAESFVYLSSNAIKLNEAHNLMRFPRLKSLYLGQMRLSAELFDKLSSDNYFPCLEELELYYCHGFEEFVLSSRSIKRLIISHMSCKGDIDAPNILYFKVSNTCGRPPSISLKTTTSREWKSQVDILYSCGPDIYGTTYLLKINELLKALSQSQVSFRPSDHYFSTKHGHFMGEPAVVELLDLSRCNEYHSFLSYPDILICFFRICRPRYIKGLRSNITLEAQLHGSGELTSCKSKIIINFIVGKSDSLCFWQQDLEEIRSEVWDYNAKEWHHVQLGTLDYSTLRVLSDNQAIRYRLKWRGGQGMSPA